MIIDSSVTENLSDFFTLEGNVFNTFIFFNYPTLEAARTGAQKLSDVEIKNFKHELCKIFLFPELRMVMLKMKTEDLMKNGELLSSISLNISNQIILAKLSPKKDFFEFDFESINGYVIHDKSMADVYTKSRFTFDQDSDLQMQFGHRGFCKTYDTYGFDAKVAENSKAMFELANNKHNLEGIEFDLKFTQDGKSFIYHDDSIRSVENPSQIYQPEDLTLEQLQSQKYLSVHYPTDLIQKNTNKVPKIITFEELLETVNESIVLDIEMKYNYERPECMISLRDQINKTFEILEGKNRPYFMSDFDAKTLLLARIKNVCPTLYLIGSGSSDNIYNLSNPKGWPFTYNEFRARVALALALGFEGLGFSFSDFELLSSDDRPKAMEMLKELQKSKILATLVYSVNESNFKELPNVMIPCIDFKL